MYKPIYTLGGLQDVLKVCSPGSRVKLVVGERLHDFDGFGSWRGRYADAAVGFANPGEIVTVRGLLSALKEFVAEGVMHGHKGGEYGVCWGTNLLVDNPGHYSGERLLLHPATKADGTVIFPTCLDPTDAL